MLTTIFAQKVNDETGWAFDQSTLQAFYQLVELTIDDLKTNTTYGYEYVKTFFPVKF